MTDVLLLYSFLISAIWWHSLMIFQTSFLLIIKDWKVQHPRKVIRIEKKRHRGLKFWLKKANKISLDLKCLNKLAFKLLYSKLFHFL